MSPKKISIKDKQFLFIIWDDDSESKIKLSNLRRLCPCAFCLAEKEEHGDKYIPIYTLEQTTVTDIKMLGHYAIGLTWKDNHDTGIYEFEQLKKMSITD